MNIHKPVLMILLLSMTIVANAQFAITSTAFVNGENIPARYTAFNGINVNPPLRWVNKPAGTQSFLLVLYDRSFCSGQADSNCRSHWVLKDIPATVTSMIEGSSSAAPIPSGAILGKSDNAIHGVAEYTGPFPDSTTVHLYEFKLYALNVPSLNCVTPYYNLCLQRALQGKVLGTASLFGYYFPRPFTPLPVQFVSVAANCTGNSIACKWSTAFETATADRFTIQRSDDGNNFESIGTVPCSGNSNSLKEYVFSDTGNRFGQGFYRIQQTDRDGRVQNSFVSYVQCRRGAPSLIQVLQNPTSGPFKINFANPTGQLVQIGVYDVTGKLVYSNRSSATGGQLNLLQSNAPGVYLLKASFNKGTTIETIKLVKLR